MMYSFSLEPNLVDFEDFEKQNNNIALFKVYDNHGADISGQVRYVIMFLSTNAMIGLGTELIRLAHNFEEGKEVKIVPASKEHGAQQSMGVFLTPDSFELVIKCENFKPIDYYVEEYRKKTEKDQLL